jgi:hypothetical protein
MMSGAVSLRADELSGQGVAFCCEGCRTTFLDQNEHAAARS